MGLGHLHIRLRLRTVTGPGLLSKPISLSPGLAYGMGCPAGPFLGLGPVDLGLRGCLEEAV